MAYSTPIWPGRRKNFVCASCFFTVEGLSSIFFILANNDVNFIEAKWGANLSENADRPRHKRRWQAACQRPSFSMIDFPITQLTKTKMTRTNTLRPLTVMITAAVFGLTHVASGR